MLHNFSFATREKIADPGIHDNTIKIYDKIMIKFHDNEISFMIKKFIL